jgi:hypothetical protein
MRIAAISFAALTAIALVSCGGGDTDADRAKAAIEAQPVRLDAEQVSLGPGLVDCGVENDLWDKPVQVSGDRYTAQLTQKGQDLKFADHVLIGEPGYKQAYVQIRGEFSLQVDDVSSVRDGDEAGTKIALVKAGIKLSHACFPNPLPLMGIKRGNFSEGAPVSFVIRVTPDGWRTEKLIH